MINSFAIVTQHSSQSFWEILPATDTRSTTPARSAAAPTRDVAEPPYKPKLTLVKMAKELGLLFPSIEVRAQNCSLTIPRSEAIPFDIGVFTDCGRVTLQIGDWYDDLESLESVFQLVQHAISGELRLRIDLVGSRARRTSMELVTWDGHWMQIGEMTAVGWLWRGEKSTEIRQSSLVQRKCPPRSTVCSEDAM